MFKVLATGVRERERELYRTVNHEAFHYDLKLVPETENVLDPSLYEGEYQAVITGNSTTTLDDTFFATLEKNGIRVFIAKMTGINQVDKEAAKRHGVRVANVQSYSPNAIAELALGMALSLNRSLPNIQEKEHHNDFVVDFPYATEIRDSKVGILGTGHIGMVCARYFDSLGAEVYGFDKFEKEENKRYLTYQSLEKIFRTCDIISVHLPYLPGVNEHIVGADLLAEAKKNLILINAARGELVDLGAVVAALKEGRIRGFGADVLENEKYIYARKVEEITDPVIHELLTMQDRIIVTPHIGAHTYRARRSLIEIAMREAKTLYETGEAQFRVV